MKRKTPDTDIMDAPDMAAPSTTDPIPASGTAAPAPAGAGGGAGAGGTTAPTTAVAPKMTPVPDGATRPPPTPSDLPPGFNTESMVPQEFQTWQLPDRFVVKRFLGRGAYGSVCEAYDKVTKRRVAIKRISDLFDVRENAKRIFREVQILRLLDHPMIVKILHLHMPATKSFNDLYIVFECMDTDFGRLTGDGNQCLTVEHVRWLLYQMLLALKYIHSAGVIHRDLKPANVLITASCDLKVCDFGLARAVGNSTGDSDTSDDDDPSHPPTIHRQLTRHVVTRWYRAPELIMYNDGDYTSAIDVWSAGCVMAEMLGMLDNPSNPDAALDREALFPGSSCYPVTGAAVSPDTRGRGGGKSDQLSVIFKVLGSPDSATIAKARTKAVKQYLSKLPKRTPQDLQKKWPTAPPEALDLLYRMLTVTPEDRCTIDDALRHPFIEPVYRATEEEIAAHQINFDMVHSSDNIRQLMYAEVALYNQGAAATCNVPVDSSAAASAKATVKGAAKYGTAGRVVDPKAAAHAAAAASATASATATAGGAGGGAGVAAPGTGGGGGAAATTPASASSGDISMA